MRPLGLFHQMWACEDVADRDMLRAAIEDVKLAEDSGFVSVWIGEHHVAPGGPSGFHGRIPASEVFLAYLAASTRRIALGTGVKILSTTSARRAAEEMATLALLAPGRVEFGLGQGPTLPGASESREEKAAAFRERLGEILDWLVDGRSRDGAVFSLAPAPELAAKIWVAARDAPTIAFAARRGLHLVVGQAEPGAKQAEYVRRYRAEGGRGEARGARLVFVAPTQAEAERDCAEATEIYFGALGARGYHAEAVAAGRLPASAATPAERRRQLDFLAGDPETVAAALDAYVEETGVDRLDVMAHAPGLSGEAVRRSMALIQSEVRPRLRAAAPKEAGMPREAGMQSAAGMRNASPPRSTTNEAT